MTMMQAPTKTIKLIVLTGLVCIVLPHLSSVAGEPASTTNSNITCQPGSFSVLTANGPDCQLCPPGTFSDSHGAESCQQCLDTIYNEPGANSAERVNGDLYCINTEEMYDTDDDVWTETTVTVSPTSLQMTAGWPSAAPSRMWSFIPSNLPSAMSSTMESRIELDAAASSLCIGSNIEDEYFEWYGRCRECPARFETILFPFLLVILLALILTLLEYMLPSCHTAHVWWGVEYLQMIYLVGILPIPWSPIAEFVFTRLLPIFALDLNASFSLQCMMNENWPQQEAADHLLMLLLPLILAILLTFLSKISKDRIIRDESVSRWMTLILNLGYLKLVLTSLELIQVPESWAADDLSLWTKTDPFYATVAGLTGLLIYGVAFPIWFVYSLFRYNRLDIALTKTNALNNSGFRPEGEEEEDRKRQQSMKKKQTMRKKGLFMTIGIFPTTLGPRVWWWPGLWMLRKFLLAILLALFPGAPILLLVTFLMIYFLGVVLQHHSLPLSHGQLNKANDQKKSWHHVATVDTILQFCLACMVGVAFFSLWSFGDDGSTKSSFQMQMEGSLVLSILVTSSIYLTLAIGICCAGSEPRFRSSASRIVVNNSSGDDDCTSFTTKNDTSGASVTSELPFKRSFSTESSSSQESHQDANTNQIDAEYGAKFQDENSKGGSARYSPYVIGEDDDDQKGSEKQQSQKHAKTTSSSRARSSIFRCDSTIATNNGEDDMGTVYEEVWVDAETGNEVSDPKHGNWMDTETGSLVAGKN